MHILILLGSIREGRQTPKIATHIHQLFTHFSDVDVTLVDLKAHALPIFEDRWQQKETPDPALEALGQQMHAADGIILVSPEYHGSYTGVLKNAIDHYWKEFYRKPMGVVATGAGPFGGINASTEMQQLILSLGGFAMPLKLLVPNIKYAFNELGEIALPPLEKMSQKFVDEFVWFTRAIVTAHATQPFPGTEVKAKV